MKKIISLLIATAMSLTAFVSFASAAQITSSNKATLAISLTEIDESEALDDIADFITDAGLVDYSVYTVTVTAGNLPALSKSGTKYTGEGITAVAARMTVTTSAEFEAEWNLAAPAGKGSFVNSGDDYIFSYAAANDYKKLLVAAAVEEGGSQDIATFQMVVDNNYEYNIVLDGGSNMNAAVFASATVAKGTDPYDISAAFSNITVNSTPIVLNGAPSKVDVTSVTISGATSATVGQNVALSADVQPPTATNPTVTWSKVSGVGSIDASTGVVTSDTAGDIVVKATADGVDSANYTVTFVASVSYIDPVANNVGAVDDTTIGKEFKDLQGKDVTLTKKYGIAKFTTPMDAGKTYKLYVQDTANNETEFDLNLGEINGNASFFAIVRSTTHTIKVMKLKEE